MSPPGNDKQQSHGLIGGVLDRLLGYASTPWRALFVLLLVVIAGLGFLVYQERAVLRDYYAYKPPPPAIKFSANLETIIAGLFHSTSADAISVWSINLGNVTGEFITGRRRDLSSWQLTTKVLRVFTENSDPLVTAKLLRGEAACSEPATVRFPLALALTRDGMVEACFVPIPPSRTATLIGIVILAWKDKPPESSTEAAVAAVLREEAKMIGD